MIPYDPAIDIEFRMKCSRLIHVCDHERLNSLLQTKTALSTNWYDRHSKGEKELLKDLKNAISYFFNRYLCDAKASRGDIMWTCPKEYADKLKGKGYTIQRSMTQIEKELPELQFKELESRLNCFVPCNARATNKYRKRWALAYCCNIYFNPFLKAFFEACPAGAIDLDEDAYALSCLIQWMFRSRIRDGEPIHIYSPSKRMRHLLNDWMLDNENLHDEQTESQLPEGRDGFMTEELCNEENRLTVISTARYNMFRTRSLTTIYDGQPESSHCQTMNGGL